jgi:hypothetical protein
MFLTFVCLQIFFQNKEPIYDRDKLIKNIVAADGSIPTLSLPISQGEYGYLGQSITCVVTGLHTDGSFSVSMTSFEKPGGYQGQSFRIYGYDDAGLAVLEKVNLAGVLFIQSAYDEKKLGNLKFRDKILEVVRREDLQKARALVRDEKEKKEKMEAKKAEDELANKQLMEAKEKQRMAEKAKLEDIKKEKAKQESAKLSVSKLISGLASYSKRYEDSFKESNPKIADQMQAQAITYIQNGDKRLADAIKDVNASTLPDTEKQDLIKQATEALAHAKKKVGIK